MKEFMNIKGEIKQTHELTINYNNPNLKELLERGWKPIIYDIPNYNKNTHYIMRYKLNEESDRVIATAIIGEIIEETPEL